MKYFDILKWVLNVLWNNKISEYVSLNGLFNNNIMKNYKYNVIFKNEKLCEIHDLVFFLTDHPEFCNFDLISINWEKVIGEYIQHIISIKLV